MQNTTTLAQTATTDSAGRNGVLRKIRAYYENMTGTGTIMCTLWNEQQGDVATLTHSMTLPVSSLGFQGGLRVYREESDFFSFVIYD